MSGGWQAIVLSLWAVVLVQVALVLVLYRQVGLVYLGRGEARLRDGLPLRARAPAWAGEDQSGAVRKSEDFRARALALVFADPGCAPCKRLLPELSSFKVEAGIAVIVVGSASAYENKKMAERYALTDAGIPVLTQHASAISGEYKVFATPFVYFIDAEGLIREKGIVNYGKQLREKSAAMRPREREEDVACSSARCMAL